MGTKNLRRPRRQSNFPSPAENEATSNAVSERLVATEVVRLWRRRAVYKSYSQKDGRAHGISDTNRQTSRRSEGSDEDSYYLRGHNQPLEYIPQHVMCRQASKHRTRPVREKNQRGRGMAWNVPTAVSVLYNKVDWTSSGRHHSWGFRLRMGMCGWSPNLPLKCYDVFASLDFVDYGSKLQS